MRKLASIRKIIDINPIEGADNIQVATVDGWKVVIKKGEFSVGDLAVYIEIDSWVPTELAPFLSKGKEPREYDDVPGERLRTVKLRGQISQGLLLPLYPTCNNIDSLLMEGLDVTFPLNIQKWEAPIPAQLAGIVKGNFPTRIPKTDEERVQNLSKEFQEWSKQELSFEITEKLDGSSMTVYLIDDEFGVCSRNLDLKETEENSFWRAAREQNLEQVLREVGGNIALQGELVGEGIQKNLYGLTRRHFYVFTVYDIDNGRYISPEHRREWCGLYGVSHVPVMNSKILGLSDIVEMLSFSEGKSMLNEQVEREGLVFKCLEDPGIHFKAISNRFLLKNGE